MRNDKAQFIGILLRGTSPEFREAARQRLEELDRRGQIDNPLGSDVLGEMRDHGIGSGWGSGGPRLFG